jgi:hypothetical protein
MSAELQELDRAGDQPVDVVVEIRPDTRLIARQPGAIEALDELAGEGPEPL